MAEDLAGTPASGLRVQACGDAHLLNFGIYATPERRLVFDVNDFDETLPAPFEWDVKRLAASLVVAGSGSVRRPEPVRQSGSRVVIGQRLTQSASDIFLGWTHVGARHYYVRQLRDMKASVSIEKLRPDELAEYASACGAALAGGHARSGDPAAIAAYLGSGDQFDLAIGEFAVAYADQTERDYAAYVAAIAPDGGTG